MCSCILIQCVVCACFVQVPVEVRDANKDKREALEQEKTHLQNALAEFKSIDSN